MDLALDFDPASTTYGDVVVKNGDLLCTSDKHPQGPNPVLQDCLQRIRTFRGEWFMDMRAGVPYFQTVFVKRPSIPQIELAFIQAILTTPGVYRIVRFAFTADWPKRVLYLDFGIQTAQGVVTYTGAV